MVNVTIYLNKGFDAQELVSYLLTEKLIASASIDENNISYKIVNDAVHEQVYDVITAKSKALLLQSIVKAVEGRIGAEVLINATPIIGSNDFFFELVSQNTLKI